MRTSFKVEDKGQGHQADNVETGNASYLPNGKAYELQTWCTEYRWRTKTRIAVMDHHQQGQRLRTNSLRNIKIVQ